MVQCNGCTVPCHILLPSDGFTHCLAHKQGYLEYLHLHPVIFFPQSLGITTASYSCPTATRSSRPKRVNEWVQSCAGAHCVLTAVEGNAEFARGHWSKAVISYIGAIDHDPLDDKPWSNRALAHIKLEQYVHMPHFPPDATDNTDGNWPSLAPAPLSPLVRLARLVTVAPSLGINWATTKRPRETCRTYRNLN